MSGPLAWSLGGLLVLLAAACLLDRRLCRACLTFVAFALVMAFAWWQLGAPRVALASPLPGGLVVMALGLWAFARHRHLLRQLLAFNVLGSGVFLLLAGLGGTAPEVQGLILVGLVVALVGSVLGALLLRRLHALAGQVSLEPEGGP